MSIWEILAVTGTSATILGVFLTIYAIINNRILREESKNTRATIERMDKHISEQIRKMEENISREIREMSKHLGELIVADGERTRQILIAQKRGDKR